MQTVFSQRLLAGLRTLHGEEELRKDDTFQDPDDVIDLDDSGPRLSVALKESVAEIYALPVAQIEQTPGRDHHTLEQSSAPQPPPRAAAQAAGSPPTPDLLDPVVLSTMPPQVAAFMLYEPPEPPPRWRTRAPPDGMDGGSWCG